MGKIPDGVSTGDLGAIEKVREEISLEARRQEGEKVRKIGGEEARRLYYGRKMAKTGSLAVVG